MTWALQAPFIVLALLFGSAGTLHIATAEPEALLVVSPPYSASGLTNQLTVIANALVIGNILHRDVVISQFRPHFSDERLIPLHAVLDVAGTNHALRTVLGIRTSLRAIDVEPELWLHASTPQDMNCCPIGVKKVQMPNSLSIQWLGQHKVQRLGISARTVFIWPNVDNESARILSLLRFQQLFYNAVQSILRPVLGSFLSLSQSMNMSIGKPLPIGAVHLRFEKDFLEYLHSHRKHTGSYDLADQQLLTRYVLKVTKQFPPQVNDALYVCSSTGGLVEEGISKLQAIYKNIIIAPKKGIFHFVKYKHDDRIAISLHGKENACVYCEATSAAFNARELYALIDLIVARISKQFIGVVGSSFSRCIRQLRKHETCGYKRFDPVGNRSENIDSNISVTNKHQNNIPCSTILWTPKLPKMYGK